MHRIPFLAATLAGAAIVALALLTVVSSAGASEPMPKAVLQTPVAWTPNVSGGPVVGKSYCNATFFGRGIPVLPVRGLRHSLREW